MAWTIPDKGEGDNDLQSILFQEYLDVLVAGINGTECVLTTGGCQVTGGASLVLSIAKGAVLSAGNLFAVPAGTVTIAAADPTNPRVDLVVIDSAGAKQVRTGTPAANPKPAVRTANDVVLAAVYVPPGATALATSKITDMRLVRTSGVVLKKTTAQVQFTTAVQNTYFTVTLPSGLFLAGKQLRLRCGGSYGATAAGSTWTLAIVYGGTTLFQDLTVTSGIGARGAWMLDITLSARSNTDPRLVGQCTFQTPAAKTAPGTGVAGDLAVATHIVTPIAGAAVVVDSDAADRALDIRWTMNPATATTDTILDFATVELL